MNPTQVTKKEYSELHAKCMASIRAYCRASSDLCETLGKCSPELMSEKNRKALIQAISQEEKALAKYVDIRDRLLFRLGVRLEGAGASPPHGAVSLSANGGSGDSGPAP